MSLPSPISLLVVIALLIYGCLAAFSQPPLPSAIIPRKPVVKAQSPKAMALAASQGVAMAVVVPPKPQYVQILFDIDPNNGQSGYLNLITILQGSTNGGKTWTDLDSTWGQTNRFFTLKTNRSQIYRLKTPMWTAK